MSASWRLICLCAAGAFVALAGCEKNNKELAGSTPPSAPPGQPTTGRTYDYTQRVKDTIALRAGRKWTVAIVRFGDTKDIEGVPFGPSTQPTDQKTVTFTTGIEEPGDLMKRGREVLKHELVKSQAFTVVERERILDLLREINFGKTKYVNGEAGGEVGTLLPVKYLIEGSLGRNLDRTLKDNLDKGRTYKDAGDYPPGLYDNIFNPRQVSNSELRQAREQMLKRAVDDIDRANSNVSCYLNVYDVHTGEVVATVMGLGRNGGEAIQDAVEDLVYSLSSLDTDICVASTGDDKIYLDAGADAGMKAGTHYQVLHQGKAIRDKDGRVIGHEEKEIGEIEVTDVKPLMSVAKVVTGKAGDVVRGDVAKPVKK